MEMPVWVRLNSISRAVENSELFLLLEHSGTPVWIRERLLKPAGSSFTLLGSSSLSYGRVERVSLTNQQIRIYIDVSVYISSLII